MVIDGGVTVPVCMLAQVYLEVVDLLSVYAPLRQAHLGPDAPLPALPAAHVPMPPGGFSFNHTLIGAHKVLERISSGVGCPFIGSLPRGCIICRVNVQYSNCAVSLRIVKQ